MIKQYELAQKVPSSHKVNKNLVHGFFKKKLLLTSSQSHTGEVANS